MILTFTDAENFLNKKLKIKQHELVEIQDTGRGGCWSSGSLITCVMLGRSHLLSLSLPVYTPVSTGCSCDLFQNPDFFWLPEEQPDLRGNSR